MVAEPSAQRGFGGLRVVAFESRLAEQMAQLIERCGGRPTIAPSLREVPLSEHQPVFDFGERLLRAELHMVILLTGIGTRFMLELLDTRWPRERIIHALSQTVLVVRGPKPTAVLREQGLKPTVAVPEPNTWKDIIEALDARNQSMADWTIAVQEYGVSNGPLLKALAERAGTVLRVPVYRWALPEDTGPLKQAISAIITGEVEVVLFTNAAQADHMLRIAEEMGNEEQLRRAFVKAVVASVGPTAADHLRELNLPVDFQPSHSKMGTLVKETSERAALLLERKRGAP